MDNCHNPLPPHAKEGLRLFNAGEYFEAHEALELVWREETGQVRRLYQGILETAVTYLHIQRGNYVGAVKVYDRSMKWLRDWPDVCCGVNVGKLRADLERVVGFIANEKAVDVRFVGFFIRTIKDNLEQFAPATAQKNINLNILQNVAVPLPPIAEQKRIVAKIEAMFAQADIIEQAASVSLRHAGQVDQSILARAFRGELG